MSEYDELPSEVKALVERAKAGTPFVDEEYMRLNFKDSDGKFHDRNVRNFDNTYDAVCGAKPYGKDIVAVSVVSEAWASNAPIPKDVPTERKKEVFKEACDLLFNLYGMMRNWPRRFRYEILTVSMAIRDGRSWSIMIKFERKDGKVIFEDPTVFSTSDEGNIFEGRIPDAMREVLKPVAQVKR